MNNTTTAALRELAEKWVHQLWALGADGFYHPAEPYFIDDLTALTSKLFVPKEQHDIIVATADRLLLEVKELYPKEFVLWLNWDCSFDLVRDVDGVISWFDAYNEIRYTLDGIYQWWKENVR